MNFQYLYPEAVSYSEDLIIPVLLTHYDDDRTLHWNVILGSDLDLLVDNALFPDELYHISNTLRGGLSRYVDS